MVERPVLHTAVDRLSFDPGSGRLVSLRSLRRLDIELLASAPEHPALALQYLDASGAFVQVDSHEAEPPEVSVTEEGGERRLTIAFRRVGGLDLDVELSVRASAEDRFSRWTCRVRNGAGVRLVDVQFPFVVVPAGEDAKVLLPASHGGHLIEGAALQALPVDEPRRWQLIPENGNSPHYPGRYFAQFLACCRPQGGVYLACEDTEANVKLLGAVRREPGVRLGIAHVGDWPSPGERTLEYEVVLGTFEGDWYDAADLYREWTLRQKWATPLTRRTDVPQWLLDSPPHITIRLQGYVDDGPAPAIEEFLPYERCLPLLQGVADRVEAPLTAVLMSWERGGPWVYPDCFPPVGGDGSLAGFIAQARERGWHVGSFCNGTRWVTRHLFNGYEGQAYFEAHRGEQGACRRADGELWAEHWDANWRPSYICCMAAEQTREIAVDFVRRLIGWGMESIQYFDQNCNAATFPCFSAEHGHPAVPGKWMAAAMERMIADFRRLAEEAGESAVIQSTENPCNETCLQLFQQSDVRVSPPGSGLADFVPLYRYLYHECSILHGMMSTGGEPYALPIRNAWNGVLGEIPGAVLTGDGELLNRETFNWAEWEPKVGSNEDALEMIRTVTALRRGAGRDFLVYGRMQRPAELEGLPAIEWERAGRRYAVPALAHAAWQAPDGRLAVALANWTTEAQTVTVKDARLRPRVSVHVYGREVERGEVGLNEGRAGVSVPALGCVLVEG
ncbi:MAG: hypothetical protein FJX74_19320 [Armatimonadetes bacterium]|nr:hypothetical protein [Armatimonadota bacterium]